VLASYSHTTFGGNVGVNPANPATTVPPATVGSKNEDAFLTRLQLSF
jgi:hypothetical protein